LFHLADLGVLGAEVPRGGRRGKEVISPDRGDGRGMIDRRERRRRFTKFTKVINW